MSNQQSVEEIISQQSQQKISQVSEQQDQDINNMTSQNDSHQHNSSSSDQQKGRQYPKRESNSKYIKKTDYNTGYNIKSAKKPAKEIQNNSQKRKGDSCQLDKAQKKYSQPKSQHFFLYSQDSLLPDLNQYLHQTIEVRIHVKDLTIQNRNLINRQIYGSENYTSNSDAVCILLHQGMIKLEDLKNSEKVVKYDQIYCKLQQNSEGVQIFFKVQRSRKSHAGSSKNFIVSRSAKGYQGLTIKPEGFLWLKDLGKENELKDAASRMSVNWIPGGKRNRRSQPIDYRAIVPISETHIVFNINNEPSYKYSIANICDKSQDIKTWTSYKLKSQVLYLESANERFEISKIEPFHDQEEEIFARNQEDNLFENWDCYRFAKIKDPLMIDNEFMESVTRPLPVQYIQILQDECDWSQFQFGSDSLCIKDIQIFDIRNYKYYSRTI